MARLILFNKPYLVLSQFTDPEGRPTLADYIPIEKVYAAGRLDYDSEGLVILTDSGRSSIRSRIPTTNCPRPTGSRLKAFPEAKPWRSWPRA